MAHGTLFLDNSFRALQRKDYSTEIVMELVLGAVILIGDLNVFHSVIFGDFRLWGEIILALQRNGNICSGAKRTHTLKAKKSHEQDQISF